MLRRRCLTATDLPRAPHHLLGGVPTAATLAVASAAIAPVRGQTLVRVTTVLATMTAHATRPAAQLHATAASAPASGRPTLTPRRRAATPR